jgi:DNA-binding NarL/FixJ family response regulator
VALAQGDAPGALRLARQAAADADAVGATLDAARALIVAGRALGPGDRDAAVAVLEDARVRAAECGADRVRDEAVRELRRLGRRVGRGGARATEGGGLAGLTGREREIASLVAAGLTNRQIGGRLHLSEKTVETHLSRVFAKLGVRGRAAVAARVTGGDPA